MAEKRMIPVVELEAGDAKMPRCCVGQKVCVPGDKDELCVEGSILRACYTPRCRHWALWVSHESDSGAQDKCPIFYMEGKPRAQDLDHSSGATVHLSVYHKHQISAKDEGKPWHLEAPGTEEGPATTTEGDEQRANKELAEEEKACFALGLPSRTCRFILGHDPMPEGGASTWSGPSSILESAEAAPEDVGQLATPKAGRRRTSSGVFCPHGGPARNDPFAGSWLFDDGQDGQNGVWEAFVSTPGAVFTKADASLVDHTEDYIVNLCDCISQCTPAADVLARRVFSKYPSADVYRMRKMGAASSKPGTASCTGVVINLFCKFVPGPPLPSAQDVQRSPYADELLALQECDALALGEDWVDSAKMRLAWFRQAMEDMASQLAKLHCPSTSSVYLGLPGSIGEAEEMGPQFLAAVHTFAAEQPWLKISIYD